MKALIFRKRFVRPVLLGLKVHTIRDGPARYKPEERLSLRFWTDRGYRSPQMEFARATVESVIPVYVDVPPFGGGPYITLAGHSLTPQETDAFAVSDGFHDAADMLAYYKANRCDGVDGHVYMFTDIEKLFEWRHVEAGYVPCLVWELVNHGANT